MTTTRNTVFWVCASSAKFNEQVTVLTSSYRRGTGKTLFVNKDMLPHLPLEGENGPRLQDVLMLHHKTVPFVLLAEDALTKFWADPSGFMTDMQPVREASLKNFVTVVQTVDGNKFASDDHTRGPSPL